MSGWTTWVARLGALVGLVATPLAHAQPQPAPVAPDSSPPQGPFAVFYGPADTFLVDAGTGALVRAAGHLASHGAEVWRYRTRLMAHEPPKGPDGLRGEASRWSVYEGHRLGDAAWQALTPDPGPPAFGQHTDEQAVLQFRGHSVTLLAARRERLPERTLHRAEVRSLSLPSGAPVAVPPVTEAALAWLDARLPGLVDPCVRRPAGRLVLDLAGGREGHWLLLAGAEPACAEGLHALAVGAPGPAVWASGAARWTAPSFSSPEGDRADVVDVRPSPDGQLALLLTGTGSAPEAPVQRAVFEGLVAPCAEGRLLRWQAGGTLDDLGAVPALTGLRWLEADDPLLAAAAEEFLPLEAPCYAPLLLGQAGAGSAGHRCRTESADRLWGGRADLDAVVRAGDERGDFVVLVDVLDAERRPGDRVLLWLGPGKKPLALEVSAGGLRVLGGEDRALAAAARGAWRGGPDGYQVEVRVPRGPLGDPPAVTVRVEDADAAGTVALWAAGRPIHNRQPQATPCEVSR